ncbi:hypothetical protein [Acetobacter oeni]|uniref:Uncharacterized protein n=1 Tax=Acetobacter oeni TaxID=304077 RepID=A0A511XPD6_9PROT|nr:hypothetical protein [Acetobacter oeni]MBB3884601.1 hypothetical protein [Acetobacter oeni]NHO20544.1 hypothetical protein [Acetobacter oeni]GBR07495.1 hypothetical protein AA21952_2357 [Acetobacter oeni LMG 21952]GEN64815.1 hypothetical protein AOE01nite_30390 [Acetobacter oeni]
MSETMQKTGDIEDVLKILDRVQSEYKKQASGQAAAYDRLRQESHEPGADSDPQFRTRVAYAVQDVERLLGPTVDKDNPLRAEMTERAAHYPGLNEPNVVALMQETHRLKQPEVNAIRSLASELVEGRQDPDHPDIAHTIDKLKATVFPEPGAKSEMEPKHSAEAPHDGTGDPDSTRGLASPGGGNPPGQEPSATNKPEQTHAPDPHQDTGSKTAGPEKNTPENRSTSEKNTAQEKEEPKRKDEKAETSEREEVRVIRGGGFARLAEAIGSRIESQPANPGPSWMEKAADFSARLHNVRDEKSLEATERLGKDAVEALREIKERPASSIMASISDAAKSDPNGMAGVLSEMKAGGKYADLHSQFETEKQSNHAFATQLENVSSKLEAYGKGREAAEATGQRMGMPGSVTQRFNQIDAEIGKSAAEVPGKKEGTSALEEMSEKVRVMVQKAVTAVTDFMKRMSPGPSHSPSP